MPPTIYDIAREAKVGIGTVSRVLNNHPSVSEDTRARVLRVASRLNYRPHPYARGLASSRTNAILAVIPFFTTFFFHEIFQGVQARLRHLDWDIILYGVNHPDQVEASLRHNVLRNRVDGVLFFSMKMPERFAEQYLDQKTPIVLVDAYHKNFDSLTVDNLQGGYAATRHLLSLGHKRVGMLSANIESLPARDRLSGFKQALAEAGIPVDPSLIKSSASPKPDGFAHESGHAMMRQFLDMGSRKPTALVVSSDIQAVGALAALKEAGLRCPDDIALVGFDDIELAQHLGLTTIHQPMYEMGVLAAEILSERLHNPSQEITHKLFVPKLIVRETCGSEVSKRPATVEKHTA
ncbi:MAG: LacI family transcriptional regulator [Ignavibacteria bacterium]|nr:LacI family transcriptional regulator [Ignavibacteria bacterium]